MSLLSNEKQYLQKKACTFIWYTYRATSYLCEWFLSTLIFVTFQRQLPFARQRAGRAFVPAARTGRALSRRLATTLLPPVRGFAWAG